MAVVTVTITPTRSYSPFEGLSEAQRLVTSVPRGLVRFFSDAAIDAKPVNDQMIVSVTGSLPAGFAYILSSLSWQVIVPRSADWTDLAMFRIFNGLQAAAVPNEQVSLFNLTDLVPQTTLRPNSKILEFTRGSIREWYPQPLVQSKDAAGMSFTLQGYNPTATVDVAGTQFFNAAFYQYELNQAVRFPLNSPLPTAIR